MFKPHVTVISNGHPFINGVVTAVRIAGRHDGSLVAESCEPLSIARDRAVATFLESACTHLLLLQQHLLPPDDVAERLLATNADVAVASCPQWIDGELKASVQALADRTWPVVLPRAVFRVRVALPGCLLIARRVLESQPGPWFSQARITGHGARTEAEWFSEKVRRSGHSFMCDGRIEVGHWRHCIDLLEIGRGLRQEAAAR
jgi:hypothetical protein